MNVPGNDIAVANKDFIIWNEELVSETVHKAVLITLQKLTTVLIPLFKIRKLSPLLFVRCS